MKNYQLELRQIVDFPRCRIYREFVQDLLADRSIRTGGCSGLFYFVVLCSYANFRTSYRRIDGISYTVYPGEWICSITDITEWFRVRFHYQAFAILKSLQDRQLITFTRLGRGHIVKFSIMLLWFLAAGGDGHRLIFGGCDEVGAYMKLTLWHNTAHAESFQFYLSDYPCPGYAE